jgi:hypothetical protein
MSRSWRLLVLSLAGIVATVAAAGGTGGGLVVIFLGIPVVALTIGLIAFETRLGKYGRYVVACLCAAPGLCLWVAFLKIGGDARYVATAVACFLGWAALWYMTAPRAFSSTEHQGTARIQRLS